MKNENSGCLEYFVLVLIFALSVWYFKEIYESSLPLWLKWFLLK